MAAFKSLLALVALLLAVGAGEHTECQKLSRSTPVLSFPPYLTPPPYPYPPCLSL